MPTVADIDSVQIPNYYEAAPADFEAVERFLRQVPKEEDLTVPICQMIRDFLDCLSHFRRIELQHARSGNGNHRFVLQHLKEAGELLAEVLAISPGMDISDSGYTREDFHANLKYLTDRFDIWYGPKDEEKATAFLKLIRGEGQ